MLPERRAEWRRDAVALGVQISAHFHRIARQPLIDVVVLRRFDQKRVLAFRFAYARYADAIRVCRAHIVHCTLDMCAHKKVLRFFFRREKNMKRIAFEKYRTAECVCVCARMRFLPTNT